MTRRMLIADAMACHVQMNQSFFLLTINDVKPTLCQHGPNPIYELHKKTLVPLGMQSSSSYSVFLLLTSNRVGSYCTLFINQLICSSLFCPVAIL